MQIRIESIGTVQVSREFLRWGGHAQDMRPMWPSISEFLRHEIEQQFESQGSHFGGGKWKPLKETTVAYKAANNLDPRILHATLAMRESLTNRGRSVPEGVRIFERNKLVFGTKVDYAGIHQQGNPAGRPPQRKIIDLPETSKRKISKAIQRFIVTGQTSAIH